MVFKGAKAFSRILITFQRTSLLLVVRCIFVPSGSFEDYFETFFPLYQKEIQSTSPAMVPRELFQGVSTQILGGLGQLKLKACASFVRGTCTISLHSQVKYPPHKNTRGSNSGQIDPIGIRSRPWLVEHKSPVASLIQTILTLPILQD